ncbi:hypothetical protein A0H81_04991 [Grifola frondosa]|uniref:Uncharacterized protein n=1 Tax=Grifola frondosa TaxID=5627 RepID=A0A1C7MFS7_GRIFR|nr:hypothetical protein A0H81_04991 [Grifola frondosa]
MHPNHVPGENSATNSSDSAAALSQYLAMQSQLSAAAYQNQFAAVGQTQQAIPIPNHNPIFQQQSCMNVGFSYEWLGFKPWNLVFKKISVGKRFVFFSSFAIMTTTMAEKLSELFAYTMKRVELAVDRGEDHIVKSAYVAFASGNAWAGEMRVCDGNALNEVVVGNNKLIAIASEKDVDRPESGTDIRLEKVADDDNDNAVREEEAGDIGEDRGKKNTVDHVEKKAMDEEALLESDDDNEDVDELEVCCLSPFLSSFHPF